MINVFDKALQYATSDPFAALVVIIIITLMVYNNRTTASLRRRMIDAESEHVEAQREQSLIDMSTQLLEGMVKMAAKFSANVEKQTEVLAKISERINQNASGITDTANMLTSQREQLISIERKIDQMPNDMRASSGIDKLQTLLEAMSEANSSGMTSVQSKLDSIEDKVQRIVEEKNATGIS